MKKAVPDKKRRFELRLDDGSGVPIYRQIMSQVTAAIASGALARGDQLPTARQASVDLAVNPNTVVRAYRELEIRGVLETQQGTGTFIAQQQSKPDAAERRRQLSQMLSEFVSRVTSCGFTTGELIEELDAFRAKSGGPRR